MNVRERIARAWHEGSDHAKDGTPFGGPLCNCWQVAGRLVPMLSEAWADAIGEAYDRGWIHDYGRDEMIDRNPFEEDRHVDQ